jgi:Glycosyl transferase family 2
MRVHLHTLCWNEVGMLEWFFRHYEPWVEQFFIYDDASMDGTREYLERRANVTVEALVRADADSWVRSAKQIYDTSWKRSIGLADWVVVTNMDEHMFHHDMLHYLKACHERGITAIPALGYQMITRDWPSPGSVLWRDHPEGAPWVDMSKLQIFSPRHIAETNFAVGRHRAAMEGEVRLPERDEVLNLHYKYLGFDYVSSRHAALATGLRNDDLENKWGQQYLWDSETLRRDVERVYRERVNVLDPAFDHHESHPGPRWWR